VFIKDIEKLIDQKIDLVQKNPFPQTEKPMTKNEKAEWEKEKLKRKKEFFANRNSKTVLTKSFNYSRRNK
jgi:ATP-dependent RNA helicase RhlE